MTHPGETTAPIQSADLSGIIERLERATGPDHELDGMIYSALIGVNAPDAKRWYGAGLGVTNSVDMAIALAERVLPPFFGWEIGRVPFYGKRSAAIIFDVIGNETGRGRGDNAAIALVLATLRALLSNDRNSTDDKD